MNSNIKPIPASILHTGYYAYRRGNGQEVVTNVHLYRKGDRQPICNRAAVKQGEFQFCSDGAKLDYLSCPRCRQLMQEGTVTK